MSVPTPKPERPAEEPVETPVAHPKTVTAAVTSAAESTTGVVKLEGEILDELKRMNRLLYSITYGPRRYTLAFLSGISRGLGAAVGATVIFALFIAALAHLSRTPLIGNYVRHLVDVVHESQPAGHLFGSANETPSPVSTPAPSGPSGH